jgi:hypothetical protein
MCLKVNGLVPIRPCCRRICTHRWLVGTAMSRQGFYEEKNDCIRTSWRYNPLVTDIEAAGGKQIHGLCRKGAQSKEAVRFKPMSAPTVLSLKYRKKL